MNGRKTEIIVRCRIDEDIHVRPCTRVIAGIRTEQVQAGHAERPQGGLGLFQMSNDVIAAHRPNIARKLAFSNALLIQPPALGGNYAFVGSVNLTAPAPAAPRRTRTASASTGTAAR